MSIHIFQIKEDFSLSTVICANADAAITTIRIHEDPQVCSMFEYRNYCWRVSVFEKSNFDSPRWNDVNWILIEPEENSSQMNKYLMCCRKMELISSLFVWWNVYECARESDRTSGRVRERDTVENWCHHILWRSAHPHLHVLYVRFIIIMSAYESLMSCYDCLPSKDFRANFTKLMICKSMKCEVLSGVRARLRDIKVHHTCANISAW